MKATDIYSLFEAQQELVEVNMSPSNLKKLADSIPGAKVGIEYEMQIPGIFEDSGKNTTGDEGAYDIEDICNFFDDDNGINNVSYLRDRLYEDFYDWQSERIGEYWGAEGFDFFSKYCRDNATDEEVLEYLDKLEDAQAEADENDEDVSASRSDWEAFIQGQWDDQDGLYDDARQEFEEDNRDNFHDERQFLRDNGISMMSDVVDNYSVTWPTEGNEGVRELATDFMEYMGLDSVAYQNEDDERYYYYEDGYWEDAGHEKPYHLYIFEPDVSLRYNGPELVGPTQSLEQTLEDSQRIRKWASRNNATTGTKTGLHMNVSIPGFSSDKLDYVKLALLLGDQYILDQFDRYGSYYAKSALDIVKERAKDKDSATRLLNQLKNNMNQIASKIIHSGYTEKFTSINTKDNRVEFRSPGGDWLGGKFDKYENALRRFIVALDAACDPDKYRKEYETKLHTILTGDKDVKYYDPKDPANRLPGGAVNPVPKKFITPDEFDSQREFKEYIKKNRKDLRTYISHDKSLANLSKLMAGEISTTEYLRELERTRKERLKGSGIGIIHPEQVEEGDWVVTYDDGKTEETIYIANNSAVSNDNAAFTAAKKFKPQWFKPDTVQYITVTPYSFGEELEGLRLYRADYGSKSMGVVAHNEEEAAENIKVMNPEYFSDYPDTEITLHDEDETSKRKILTMLDWQKGKLEQGREWHARPKLFTVRSTSPNNGFRELIAAITREEALDIAKQMSPESFADGSVDIYVNDSLPGQERYDYFRASNQREIDLYNQRNNIQPKVDISHLKTYRVSNMNGYNYFVAENGAEAAEIANKLDPNKFPNIADLTVQDQSHLTSTSNPALIRSMYISQQQKLAQAAPAQSDNINIPAEFNQPASARISDMREYRVTNNDTGDTRIFAATSISDAMNRARREYPAIFANGDLGAALQA